MGIEEQQEEREVLASIFIPDEEIIGMSFASKHFCKLIRFDRHQRQGI
jgi:hypothetical protein